MVGIGHQDRASYSNQDGGKYIEVCDDFTGLILVWEGKDPQGPALVFPAESWTAFVIAVKNGQFAV